MTVLSDAQQADELVHSRIAVIQPAGVVGLPELVGRHSDRALNFALEIRVVLLSGEGDDGRSGWRFVDSHGLFIVSAPDGIPRAGAQGLRPSLSLWIAYGFAGGL